MDLDPVTDTQIKITLFKNVQNIEELRQKLISGKLRCCMVKSSLVYDPFQIVIAANKALTAEKLTTKSVFTEILFNLAASKNISKSLQTFGVNDEDKNIIVVTVHKKGEEHEDFLEQIEGDEIPLDNLSEFSDIKAIKEAYKIGDKESSAIPLIDSIVSRIATKDFLSH